MEMEPLVWCPKLGQAIGLLRTKRRIEAGEELTWDYKYSEVQVDEMLQWKQPDDFSVLGLAKSVADHFKAFGVYRVCNYCGERVDLRGKKSPSAKHTALQAHLGLLDSFFQARNKVNGERKAKAKRKAHFEPPPKDKRSPTRQSARLREVAMQNGSNDKQSVPHDRFNDLSI